MKGVGDFYAGMLHPVTTIETIVPLIALSLLAGQQRREVAIKILAAIPAAIVLGTLLILVRPVPAFLGVANLFITTIAGLLIALARPLPSTIPISISIFCGVAVGWANAAEITQDISPVRFISGLAIVGLLLTAYGIGLVRHLRFEWSQIAVRVVGSWLAAIGILILGLR
jgi:urease accessory protein